MKTDAPETESGKKSNVINTDAYLLHVVSLVVGDLEGSASLVAAASRMTFDIVSLSEVTDLHKNSLYTCRSTHNQMFTAIFDYSWCSFNTKLHKFWKNECEQSNHSFPHPRIAAQLELKCTSKSTFERGRYLTLLLEQCTSITVPSLASGRYFIRLITLRTYNGILLGLDIIFLSTAAH
jgi:hypothetical protein